MLQNLSWVTIADNSGVKRAKIIRVLGGSHKRFAKIGDIVVCSAKSVIPKSPIKKGQVIKAVIVSTRFGVKRKDGVSVKFDENLAVVIKEDMTPRGTAVNGAVAREIKDKQFKKIASLAEEIV